MVKRIVIFCICGIHSIIYIHARLWDMNKKFLTLIVSIFILITAVYFIFKPAKKDESVVFWTLQMSDFSEYINGVISNFEAQNPDIKIKWIDVPFSEGEKRTLASVMSDNPPDLVNLNPDFSSTLAHKGTLYEIPQNKLTQFNKEILNSTKINGKHFLIPWYATSAVTIYNKELFNKTGIAVPKKYSQLASDAKIIKDKTGAFITLPNITENDTMLKILNKYGCSGSDVISSDSCVEVFDLFKNLYTSGLIPKETITMTLQEALEKYMSENIALINAGANYLNMIKENAPSTYKVTDVAPQIKGELGQNDFSLMNFVIPLRAKHKEKALKFVLFLTNYENQLELAKLTNILAVNDKTLDNDFYKKYSNGDLQGKARVISAAQLSQIEPSFKTRKNQKDINNYVNYAVQDILLNKSTSKNIIKKLSENMNALSR